MKYLGLCFLILAGFLGIASEGDALNMFRETEESRQDTARESLTRTAVSRGTRTRTVTVTSTPNGTVTFTPTPSWTRTI
jgi:hypothetical protein